MMTWQGSWPSTIRSCFIIAHDHLSLRHPYRERNLSTCTAVLPECASTLLLFRDQHVPIPALETGRGNQAGVNPCQSPISANSKGVLWQIGGN
jgi:hypothetical protein